MTYSMVKDGKKVKVIIDSGVVHNPEPSTARGLRRKAKREAKNKS